MSVLAIVWEFIKYIILIAFGMLVAMICDDMDTCD